MSLPIIDLGRWNDGEDSRREIAGAVRHACREDGFFYVAGHGVDRSLEERLELLSREFFSLPLESKLEIAMARGGRAWRGYFPVGAELTSGHPDRKEGIYFGSELAPDDPLVVTGTPMHGANLFPSAAGWRDTVLAYMEAMTGLGHRLMEAIALSLGLESGYFHSRYTADPLVLFRIFNYPPAPPGDDNWGVGEHTDYGVLTILKQDGSGGLEVRSRNGWISAPPIDGAFVCNIGDMLERMTAGFYRSTPHRVRNPAPVDRLSFPFFFDPNFHARIQPIPGFEVADDDATSRWDGASVHRFEGTYGDYLTAKVSKVFPQLRPVL